MSYKYIIENYNRPVVHMRQQYQGKKFGLVIGSGVSKDLFLPNWKELLEGLCNNPEINGKEILEYRDQQNSQASITHMLYEHFKSQEIIKRGLEGHVLSNEEERLIAQSWLSIIHEEIWKEFKPEYLEPEFHPYLDSYIEIIKESSLTINYNFDDTIQTIISNKRTPEEKKKGIKPIETVWDARLQFQKNEGIIYHPNGFLPFNPLEGSSESIVFSEDSFADQLIASMAGHYSTLLHHLSKNTCLFIGLSLDDSNLKHILRQNAKINPGHFHYYIAYTPDKSKLSICQKSAIKESNFELYNLITLFLDNNEIKGLGELINMEVNEFNKHIRIAGKRIKFVYYLTGPVACGKTTSLHYFRNLKTFSEWSDQRNPLLSLPWDTLNKEEKVEVDEWIADQFCIKNFNLEKHPEGLTVIDRTPLDPLTFTENKSDKLKEKAIFLNGKYGYGTNAYRIVKGQIILLKGNPDVLASRLKTRNKAETKVYDANYIRVMYDRFEDLFNKLSIRIIDTTELSVHDVVRRIARIIHYEEYNENDLHSVLDDLKK